MSPPAATNRLGPQLALKHLLGLVAAVAIGLAAIMSFVEHRHQATIRVRMGVFSNRHSTQGVYFQNDAEYGGFKASVVERAKSNSFRRRIAKQTGVGHAWIKAHVNITASGKSELITLSGRCNPYFDGDHLEVVLKEYVEEIIAMGKGPMHISVVNSDVSMPNTSNIARKPKNSGSIPPKNDATKELDDLFH